jgi:hypothetical protein
MWTLAASFLEMWNFVSIVSSPPFMERLVCFGEETRPICRLHMGSTRLPSAPVSAVHGTTTLSLLSPTTLVNKPPKRNGDKSPDLPHRAPRRPLGAAAREFSAGHRAAGSFVMAESVRASHALVLGKLRSVHLGILKSSPVG